MADWETIYTEKTVAAANAADVLKNNMHLLPAAGMALDYACGLAGNGVLLAERGFVVSAWDKSGIAVNKVNDYAREKKLQLTAQIKDLENNPADFSQQFDIIIVSYFLHRKTLRTLYDYLKLGGVLFYETFSGKQLDNRGPSNEAFRLQRGELLGIFPEMQLLYYREDDVPSNTRCTTSDKVYFVARK